MPSSNPINALQVSSSPGKTLAAADTPAPVTGIEPGQQLQGAVQSRVNPGLFKVLVAGQTLQMRLPDNIRSGDVLNLRVVSGTPHLTFSLSASTAPISTHEQIGAVARLLANLAELPLEQPIVRQAGGTAVWQTTGTAPDSRQLAAALHDALANSGLFYESHQAQWVRGERSTVQLLAEPQNQLMDKRIASLGADQTARFNALNTTASSNAQNSNATDATPASGTPPDARPAIGPGAAGLPVAEELLPLVQQQLHTLETHQLTWAGQVWPGQEMQWEIQGQPEPQTTQQDERQWRTEMELALPRLGDVHARLVFAGRGLELTLQAADSATVALFNRSLPKLQSALADVNIPLTAAAVEKT